MTRALLLFLTTLPLCGQFSGLATTDDGSVLYFSSTLQLSGTSGENTSGKIFRYDSAGLHFVAQMTKVPVVGGIMLASTNPYNLTSAYVSGNGSVVGYIGVADCIGSCYYQGLLQTTLQYPGSLVPVTLPYACVLSGNARYANCITAGRETHEQYGVFDLFAGTQAPAYVPACFGDIGPPRKPTSDGRVLCGTALVSASGSTTLKIQGDTFSAIISDDGSQVALGSADGLNFYNVATGATVVSAAVPAGVGEPVAISNDGSIALITMRVANIIQIASIHTDGTGFLQLTNDPGGVGAQVLSGDGSTVYAVTNSGKLLKISTATGVSTLVTNATQIQGIQGAAVAGSLDTIQGVGLAATTIAASTFPLTTSLGGAQVFINGTAAPLLSVSPTSITFQIPWETALGNATISVAQTASPFIQGMPPLQIQAVQPVLAVSQPITQDFSGYITVENEVNPGDIVNFYLTGLGAVRNPVANGAVSPSNPPATVVNPVTVSYGISPIEVLYAGLAPGLIGVYQLSVRLPSAIPRNPLLPNAEAAELFMTVDSVLLPPVWVRLSPN